MARLTDVNYLVVHCADTYAHMNIGFAEIDEWHRANGWSGCGYHSIIRRDGTEQPGRPVTEQGAHVLGYNDESLGVCLVGGKSELDKPQNNFTGAQFDTLYARLKSWRAAFPNARIVGHRQLDKHRACPCFDVKDWWRERVTADRPAPLFLDGADKAPAPAATASVHEPRPDNDNVSLWLSPDDKAAFAYTVTATGAPVCATVTTITHPDTDPLMLMDYARVALITRLGELERYRDRTP